MIRVTKDGITLECETQADLRLALGVLAHDTDEPPLPTVPMPLAAQAIRANVPVTDDPTPITVPPMVEGHLALIPLPEEPFEWKPVVHNGVPTESHDSVSESPTVQHISVTGALMDFFDAVVLFPEGVATAAVQTLLGLTDSTASNRMQRLKNMGLVERIPHKNLWRATPLARRAKLVRA